MATEYYGQYVTALRASPKDRRRRTFSVRSQNTSKAVSTFLAHPIDLSMKPQYPVHVNFATEDKLVIIFGYNQKFVVYKKSNNTVAVFENAVFKQSNPPMMFEGAKLGALLHNVEPTLMYAVATADFCQPGKISFCKNDVILILARCREIYLGITEDHLVGFFPFEVVNTITKPKTCFFEGMVLTVTAIANFEADDPNYLSVHRSQNYEITKGRGSLFEWFGSDHLKVPLHFVGEIGTEVVTETIGDDSYVGGPYLKTIGDDSYVGDPYLKTIGDDSYVGGPYLKTIGDDTYVGDPYLEVPTSTGCSGYLDLMNGRPNEDLYMKLMDFTPFSKPHDHSEYAIVDEEATAPPLPPKIPTNRKDVYENTGTTPLKEKWHGVDVDRNQDGKYTFGDKVQLPKVKESKDLLQVYQTKKENPQALLEKLRPHREVQINDTLSNIVAESVEDEVLHSLCEQIKVSKNRLRDICNEKKTVYEKTYDLLTIWRGKFGSDANVGFLVDALEDVNPKDLNLILEDILRYFRRSSARDSILYEEIPEEENRKVMHKTKKQEKVKFFLEKLRDFRDVDTSDEIKHTVSQYIDDDVWHLLGESLEIPKTIRQQIEKKNKDFSGKTFDLLDQWHRRFGSEATLGFLLDALVLVDPDDLYLILKDLLEMLGTT